MPAVSLNCLWHTRSWAVLPYAEETLAQTDSHISCSSCWCMQQPVCSILCAANTLVRLRQCRGSHMHSLAQLLKEVMHLG